MLLFESIAEAFLALRPAPRELWLVYAIEVLDGFSVFSLMYLLVLFLSAELGFDDIAAGWVYGVHGMLTSVFGLLFGFIIDIFGVRISLIISQVVLLIGRFWLALSKDRTEILVMLYIVIPFGQSLLHPALPTGIRRYTTKENRTMAFSLFYVMMNIGALLAAPPVDIVRGAARNGIEVPLFGHTTAYRFILLLGALSTIFSLILSVMMREVDVSGGTTDNKPAGKPHEILRETLTSKRFWRFMLLILLLIGVGMIFRHLDATFPKYMVRTEGETVPFGTILSINPFLIIFIVPALSPIAKRHGQLNMIVLGSAITSTSVLWMLLGPNIWCAVLFVVQLSFGEALWSPRVFEYTSTVAPKGREGTYMALSSAPNFIAKVLVGGLSGWLLETYCPSSSRCDGKMLWFVVFLVTASSPVLLVLLKDVIQESEHDVDDDDEGHDNQTDVEKEALLEDQRAAKTVQ